jgi:hypothetical protein
MYFCSVGCKQGYEDNYNSTFNKSTIDLKLLLLRNHKGLGTVVYQI